MYFYVGGTIVSKIQGWYAYSKWLFCTEGIQIGKDWNLIIITNKLYGIALMHRKANRGKRIGCRIIIDPKYSYAINWYITSMGWTIKAYGTTDYTIFCGRPTGSVSKSIFDFFAGIYVW